MAVFGLYAAGLFHDLSHLLAGVYVNSMELEEHIQAASKKGPLPVGLEELPDIVGELVDFSERVVALVRDARGVAIRSRELPGKVAVDLNEVVRSAIRIASSIRSGRGRAVLSLKDELPRVSGDASQLQRICVNLVLNALEATPDGQVEVTTESDDDWVRISIADDGPGVPEADRVRIFEPFFTTKGTSGGSGLGLAVVRATVAKHGGRICVESSRNGGALFIVELPVAALTS